MAGNFTLAIIAHKNGHYRWNYNVRSFDCRKFQLKIRWNTTNISRENTLAASFDSLSGSWRHKYIPQSVSFPAIATLTCCGNRTFDQTRTNFLNVDTLSFNEKNDWENTLDFTKTLNAFLYWYFIIWFDNHVMNSSRAWLFIIIGKLEVYSRLTEWRVDF